MSAQHQSPLDPPSPGGNLEEVAESQRQSQGKAGEAGKGERRTDTDWLRVK